MEVCVDNLESAVNAEKGGAIRIELCSSLSEGGLTPSPGFLKIVKQRTSIPIFVMIRPRGGNFVYTADEIEIMKKDVLFLKQCGADGFVFGILTKTKKVNKISCSELLRLTENLPVTFHRAFDEVLDPLESLEDIISLGFKRILTSGLQPNALLGAALIKNLISTSSNRILIMPGAGINDKNVAEVLKITGAKEFHGSAKINSGTYYITSEDIVKSMITVYSQWTAELQPKTEMLHLQ